MWTAQSTAPAIDTGFKQIQAIKIIILLEFIE